MLFNSYSFIFIFLPIVVVLYYGLAKLKFFKLATGILVCASLIFYSYWDIQYLPLLMLSILTNFTLGYYIEKKQSKILLSVGILFNLLLLGYFKYTMFLMQNLNWFFNTTFALPDIILPLGISFYTFTQTAYLVDAYRGETEKYSFLTYILFVTFFPHLIAGPILYHKAVIPQFLQEENFRISHENIAKGITLFAIGLFKKVMIADSLAPISKAVFENAVQVTFLDAWTGALAYTLQLYFDFSGYSEMAVALGLMLNIKLPINFNSPYKAKSIIDFWRRWHITLSEFLRNYLYIPMGGNRQGELKRIRNLIVTMLLGGLWHGAGWTYVIWGALHGVFLVINHMWRKLRVPLPDPLSYLITFISIVVAWVFFRAESVFDAYNILQAMLGLKGFYLPEAYVSKLSNIEKYGLSIGVVPKLVVKPQYLLSIALLLVVVYKFKNPHQLIEEFKSNYKWLIIIYLLIGITLVNMTKVSEFLYFQF